MLRIEYHYSNGETDFEEIPETMTVAVRGGAEITVPLEDLAMAGHGKVRHYGIGRYLRDGAQSFVEYPIDPDDVGAWSKLGKRIPKGFSVNTPKDSRPSLHVNPEGVKGLLKLGLDTLPDGVTPKDFGAHVDGVLNQHALNHARERLDALISGEIPTGRAGGVQPEMRILAGWVAQILAKDRGITQTKAAKIPFPNTVGELAAWFAESSGVKVPAKYESAGAWFGTMRERAEALVAMRDEALDDIMG